MPLPRPERGESRRQFIGRCMSLPHMRNEFPDRRQRAAVCFSQWRDAHRRRRRKENAVEPLTVDALGTFDAKAEERARADGFRDVVLTLDEVKRLCPSCADKIAAAGASEVKLTAAQIAGLCRHVGRRDPGFFRRCMRTSFGAFQPSDKASFCAWLHQQCTGIFPGAHRRRSETMDGIEIKRAPTRFEVKETDEEQRTFRGLASTWELDLGGDVIHRGAFKRTLDHWRRSGRVIPLLDQHNYGSVRAVVGKLIDARETADGLDAKFRVVEGPDGDEILRRIKGGYVDGLSIGYRPVKIEEPSDQERLRGIRRHLKEIELREISVVIWPMNTGARLDASSVKALLAKGPDALTDDDFAELVALRDEIDALLTASAEADGADGADGKAADSPEGLAAEDPVRRALEARAALLQLRSRAVLI
ncbi:MAG TPA: HK97 family phage prohead protease [Longimicrobiales bacterium]